MINGNRIDARHATTSIHKTRSITDPRNAIAIKKAT